jgi:hypothetical protein
MIRLNRLLRASHIKKLVGTARAGAPGWDRPDVPPTMPVQRNTKVYQTYII